MRQEAQRLEAWTIGRRWERGVYSLCHRRGYWLPKDNRKPSMAESVLPLLFALSGGRCWFECLRTSPRAWASFVFRLRVPILSILCQSTGILQRACENVDLLLRSSGGEEEGQVMQNIPMGPFPRRQRIKHLGMGVGGYTSNSFVASDLPASPQSHLMGN